MSTFHNENASLRPRKAVPAIVSGRVGDASRADTEQVERVDLNTSERVQFDPPRVQALSVLVPAYGILEPRAETRNAVIDEVYVQQQNLLRLKTSIKIINLGMLA